MSDAFDDTVNVARFLPRQAAAQPDAMAVMVAKGRSAGRIDYETRSFAELERQSNRAAQYFADHGIERGMRTLLLVKPGLDLIRTVFALFKLGAPPIVVDPGMGMSKFLTCVRQSKPEGMVGISLAHGLRRVCSNSFKTVECAAMVGGGKFREALKSGPELAEPAQTQARDVAAILFTSGSTGPAKGVVYTHGIFEAQVAAIRAAYGIQPGEIDLPMLPVFALFNPALGMTTVVPEMNPARPAKVDPAKIVEAIQQESVTNSFGSPVLWGKIARYCNSQGISLPTMKRVLMAGAPAPPEVISLFEKIAPNATVHTPYGATECLPVSTIESREILEETWSQTRNGRGTCVGRPLTGMSLKVIAIDERPIRKMEDAVPIDTGSTGEVIVTGPVVTTAYDHLPEATAKAKIVDEGSGETWHRMGDAGYLDAKGRLWFCGRLVERVVTDSETFFTDPCEAPYNQLPGVFRTALIGVEVDGKMVPALVVEPEEGKFPASEQDRDAFVKCLVDATKDHRKAGKVTRFFFKRSFPVDVRHNAKIHRLTLAKWATTQHPVIVSR